MRLADLPCKLNYLKENFCKVFTFRVCAWRMRLSLQGDCGVIWGCEVGGDRAMQDVRLIFWGFCPDPKSNAGDI